MVELFKDLPVVSFKTQEAFRTWLKKHHESSSGIWLRIFKKDSGKATVTYAQALDEALCFGWIDSTKNSYDDESFLQRFGPRKSRSLWSKINREHVARLIKAKQMEAAGLRAVEEAKKNGQWENAYDGQEKAELHPDFKAALDENPRAKAFYESLNRANKYAFYFRINNVKKEETRKKKIAWAIDMLTRGEKLH